MRKINLLLLILLTHCFLSAQEFSQWRGPNRSGIYSETGLLKKWPEKGPELIWFNDSLPTGNSSASVADNKIYVTGLVDSMDVLIALNAKGELLWQTIYGKAWTASFPESRSAPTIDNNKVYVSSGNGDVACIDAKKGNIIWKVKACEQFSGSLGRWGIAESILVDEKNAFFTTGGNQTTMIAMDKNTGEIVWKSESLNDRASYTSPLMIEKDGKKQIVQVAENYLFGVQPEDGKIVWKFDFGKYKKERNNNTNTPLYDNGELYVTSGYDHQGVKLKLADDLSNASFMWSDTILDTHLGGVVKVGDYIYGSNWLNNSMGNWVCIDWKTGKLQYETKWKNKGSIIFADGLLYCYEEKTGHVALVEPNPKEFKIISEFKVEHGKGPYWAHPVIRNGVLYLRHGGTLMAYDIKGK